MGWLPHSEEHIPMGRDLHPVQDFQGLVVREWALGSDVLGTSVKPLAHPLKHLAPESHADYVATSEKLLS